MSCKNLATRGHNLGALIKVIPFLHNLQTSRAFWGEVDRAKQRSILWLTEKLHLSSSSTRLQHTGHVCLQLAGVKSKLLLTSIGSGHTVMHSFYINRRLRRKVAMHHKPSAIQATVKGSQLPCAFFKQPGLSSQLGSPRTVDVHVLATPKHFSSPSLPIGKVCATLLMLESILQSENVTYTSYDVLGFVKLHSKQTWNTYYRYIYIIYIYIYISESR